MTPLASPLREKKVWGICILLLVLAGWTFLPALRNGFTNYDDDGYITGNGHVTAGLTWNGVGWAFTTLELGSWNPLTWLSIMIDCQLFGKAPAGHHGMSIALHAANTVLLFVLLWQITGATWRSAFVAAIFGVHPLHVESVAWAAERKDVLSGLFFMLTLLSYTIYVSKRNDRGSPATTRSVVACRGWYAGALVCFVLGLMSKPMLVTVPLLLLLLDWWPLGRWDVVNFGWRFPARYKGLLLEKLPFLAAAFGVGILTILGQIKLGALQPTADIPTWQRLANAMLSCATYLVQTVWPANLAVFYSFPRTFQPWMVAAAGLTEIVVSVIALVMIRRRPYLSFGWFWYLIMLLPVIGVLQVGGQAHADRYTYLPLIGVFIVVAWGASELAQNWRWRVEPLAIGSIMVVACCVLLSRRQVGYWRSSEALFRHALAVTGDNELAHCKLGTALMSQGRVDEAIAEFQKSVSIEPRFVLARVSLGVAVGSKGRMDEAIEELEAAVRLAPNDLDVRYNLGVALLSKNRYDDALAQFREALRIQPGYERAEENVQATLAAKAAASGAKAAKK